jgi:hypothetical protein
MENRNETGQDTSNEGLEGKEYGDSDVLAYQASIGSG